MLALARSAGLLQSSVDLEDRHHAHVLRFIDLTYEGSDGPEELFVNWLTHGRHLPSKEELRGKTPEFVNSYIAWLRLVRGIDKRARREYVLQRPVNCSGRHRRAPDAKPVKRRGSRRTTAPTRGSPDDDPHELPSHLAAASRLSERRAAI